MIQIIVGATLAAFSRHLLQPIWQEAIQKWEGAEGCLPVVAGSASLKEKTLFLKKS